MPRYSGLALAKHLSKFADRQFHQPEERKDAQPRGIGERLESIRKWKCCSHQITI